MKLILIPEDKANHFVYGFVIYLLANIFLIDFYSLLVVLTIAIGKEVYDELSKKGRMEFLDIMYTIVPALLIILFKLLEQ